MSQMTLKTMAKEIMRPTPPPVTLQALAADALAVMRREDADFLPVVTPDTEKFVGIVLRRALELGCERMGHRQAECMVVNHLKADVDFCFADEPADIVLEEHADTDAFRAGLRDTRSRARLRLPVIVVDERKVPIGMIERSAA